MHTCASTCVLAVVALSHLSSCAVAMQQNAFCSPELKLLRCFVFPVAGQHGLHGADSGWQRNGPVGSACTGRDQLRVASKLRRTIRDSRRTRSRGRSRHRQPARGGQVDRSVCNRSVPLQCCFQRQSLG
jgi:hypothetical protein